MLSCGPNSAEESSKADATCRRRPGVSDATFYDWKVKCGGLEGNEARRLCALEEENSRLKKIVAQRALDIDALKIRRAEGRG